MAMLKLLALDEADLTLVSAHVQDAVTRVGDIKYMESTRRFIVPMNRFAWETQSGFFKGRPERRNSVLHFDRVRGVQANGIPRDKPAETLALLAVGFEARDAPCGSLSLVFSGGGTIRLDVECIEAQLSDLGGAWEASSRPRHGS